VKSRGKRIDKGAQLNQNNSFKRKLMDDSQDLATLTVAATLGDEAAMRILFQQFVDQKIPIVVVLEVLLQTALFAGVPRCLNAFRIFHHTLEKMEDVNGLEDSYQFTVVDPQKSGAEVFEKVYGDKHFFLKDVLNEWHPALKKWIISAAYGEILSRPFLELKQREICAVAALTALNLPLQLRGHMKGALRQGVKKKELIALIEFLNTDHKVMALEMLSGMDA